MNSVDQATYFADEFRPVQLDLLTSGFNGEVTDARDEPNGSRLIATLSVDDVQIGTVAIDLAGSPEGRLQLLADFTQDLVLENVRVAGKVAIWPPCIDDTHTHPMTARIVADRAKWVCPADRSVSVLVGELSSPAR